MPAIARRGILRRLLIFEATVSSLADVAAIDPALAVMRWSQMKPGLAADPALNPFEKAMLIDLGDSIITPLATV